MRVNTADHSGALACRGGRHLLARSEETTCGWRFRSAAAAIACGEPPYPSDLYDGAAGVALALYDLHTATGEDRWRKLADVVAEGLRESTPGKLESETTGLYVGLGGLLLLHLRRAAVFGNLAGAVEARRLAAHLATGPLAVSDLLLGAAGTGLALVAWHRATGDRHALAGVRRCLAALQAKAVPWRGGLAWPAGNPPGSAGSARRAGPSPERLETGFAHGIAGIAVFLLEARAVLPRDPVAAGLSAQAMASLAGLAIRRGATCVWPDYDRRPRPRFHWCHGTTGIAQAYLAHYRHTGDPQSLATACAAARHTWHAMGGADASWTDLGTGHCHGLAGALELFVDLYEHGGGAEWEERACAVGRRFAAIAGPGAGPSSLGGDGCGLAHGTAGIVRALLRLAGHPALAPWRIDPTLRLAPGAKVPPPVPLLFSPRPRRLVGAPPARVRLAPIEPRSPLRPSAAWMPPVAGRLRDSDKCAVLGPEWDAAARRFAARFLADSASRPVHHAAEILERGLQRLRVRHRDWMAPAALTLKAQGRFLRGIAGLALQGGATATEHRSRVAGLMAERHVAALALALDRLAKDRLGVLAGHVAGRLQRFEPLGNDPHRGGQVAIGLKFERGTNLIYKPRAILLDWFLAGGNSGQTGASAASLVNQWLPARLPDARLSTHDLFAAGPWHGYAEEVATAHVPLRRPHHERFVLARLGRPAPELGTRLGPGDEARFWYSAGLLAGQAACFGLGDLHSENILCGTTRTSPRVLFHPIDLEVAFQSAAGVGQAGLTPLYGSREPPLTHSHYGLQARPSRHCSVGAEEWGLEATADGLRPIEMFGGLVARSLPNTVENFDGSFGYGRHLCPIVRGLADHWEAVRAHAPAFKTALRATLVSCRVRVVTQATQAYLAPLLRRLLGTPLWTGAAAFSRHEAAGRLNGAERRQLDALDIPYFFRRFGTRQLRWVSRPPDGTAPADFPVDRGLEPPCWSAIDRYGRLRRLALAIADLVNCGAPEGDFDQRDDRLGVRVVREVGDPRLRVAVVLQDGPCVFRLEGGGVVNWWRP